MSLILVDAISVERLQGVSVNKVKYMHHRRR